MLIDKEKLLERLYQKIELTYSAQVRQGLTIAQNIIREFSEADKWIPVTTRDMTEEEAKELLDDFDLKDFNDNPKSYWLYNCRLPDDGQEVLVSTKWGVILTTFYSDIDYGNYFEEYEDRFDVEAWQPLPEKYKK